MVLKSPRTPASFSPAFNRTYAFFQSARYPANRPRRRSLPAVIDVRTSSTFTLKSVCTACRICVLFAPAATSKHSVRSASFLVTPFSVTSGRLITSYTSHYASASESFRAAASRQQHLLVTQQVVHIHFAARNQLHAFQIPARQRPDSGSRRCPPAESSCAASSPVSACAHQLGLRLGNRKFIHHPQFAVAQLRRKRALQRAQQHLLRQMIGIIRAAADRAPSRHAATADCGSNPCAPGRCPSASTASCPTRPLHAASWSTPSRAACRPDDAAPLHTAAPHSPARRTPRRPDPACRLSYCFRSIISTLGMATSSPSAP